MMPVIALLLIAGHFHWGAGLLGFSLWLPWSVVRRGSVGLVPGWPAWILALVALIASTALSQRPSGLAWIGLLQWLSLGGGILALQAVIREQPSWGARCWWIVIGTGIVDAVVWTRDLLLAHLEWWNVRVEGLPLFPFRIRLFGSHGSTQAAAWLGLLILIGALWAYPRLRSSMARFAVLALLLWWSVLLGMCDSRLAMIAFLAATAVVFWRDGVVPRLAVLTFVPSVLWWCRDLLHPSRVVTGGGDGYGTIFLVGWFLVLVCASLLRRFLSHSCMRGRIRSVVGWCGILVPILPLAMLAGQASDAGNLWSTGRHAFWGEALRAMGAHPLLGVGPWGYVWEYARHHPWGYAFLAMHPHNVALEVAMAGGVVLLAAVSWIAWTALDWSELRWERSQDVLPAGLFLLVAMSFDSPFSSPQLLLAVIVLGALILARRSESRWDAPPRSIALLPALLLVPLGFAFEAQIGKSALVEAGGMIRAGKWDDGARQILEAPRPVQADPQWLRNSLMARTSLHATDLDSLHAYRPLWDSLTVLEPGFHPNRIHLAWIDARVSPGPRADRVLRASIEAFWRMDQPEPTVGTVPERWRPEYPNDSLDFWIREWSRARAAGDSGRARWVGLWCEQRIPAGGIARRAWRHLTGGNAPLTVRPVVEQQLYGSVGTRWLLIPQVDRMLD